MAYDATSLELHWQALAPLAALCREDGAHASAALALVTLVLRRHLPASQWLPVMQQARAQCPDQPASKSLRLRRIGGNLYSIVHKH